MISASFLRLLLLAALSSSTSPAQATNGLPFGLTENDITKFDPGALNWTSRRVFVGGAEGALRYDRSNPHPAESAECRAAALVGLVRLRNQYVRETGSSPVTLRLSFRCGSKYRGTLNFDGVVMHMELRDLMSGALLYQARERGIPSQ